MATESGDESSSPTSRIKFMCSYGGKILPRPGDGLLKYVGGETRVVAVPRDTSFSELMKKVGSLVEGELVLKFQTNSEDLDALVSVRTDEEVKLMFDEFSRLENEGASRARTYLFPANPVVLENQTGPAADPLALEQRYIDAINGIVRPGRVTPVKVQRLGYSISASSSPRAASPDNKSHDQPAPAPAEPRITIPKVWSSPSLGTLNNPPPQASYLSHQHFVHPQYQYHQNFDQALKPPCHPSPRMAQDHWTKRTTPASASACTRQDVVGVPIGHGHGLNQLYGMSPPMTLTGSGGSNRHGWHDEGLVHGNGWIEMPQSAPISPRTLFHTETGFQ